ncbi:MAG: DUF2341 domain-containing protein [Candidatus Omnitrophota bacterium]
MYKKIIIALVVCINFFSMCQNAEAGWYSSSWKKRRSVSITGSGSAQTNYQVEFDVTYDSDMQSDFDDIRFTSSNGTTEIYYWRETYTASTQATFVVEVPSIPTGGTTIYMYYGNASVATTSDGGNTFLFFDDFDDNSFDTTNKWTQVGTGTIIEQNQNLSITSNGTNRVYARSKTSLSAPYKLECSARRTGNGAGDNIEIAINWDGTIGGAAPCYYRIFAGYYAPYYNSWAGGGTYLAIQEAVTATVYTDFLPTYAVILDTSWHDYKIISRSNGDITIDFDGTEILSASDSTPRTSGYIGFSSREAPTALNSRYDTVRVSKFIDPPPAATVGNEEGGLSNVLIFE